MQPIDQLVGEALDEISPPRIAPQPWEAVLGHATSGSRGYPPGQRREFTGLAALGSMRSPTRRLLAFAAAVGLFALTPLTAFGIYRLVNEAPPPPHPLARLDNLVTVPLPPTAGWRAAGGALTIAGRPMHFLLVADFPLPRPLLPSFIERLPLPPRERVSVRIACATASASDRRLPLVYRVRLPQTAATSTNIRVRLGHNAVVFVTVRFGGTAKPPLRAKVDRLLQGITPIDP